MVARNTEDMI